MPKFHISFQTANEFQRDDEGLDVPGFEEARAAAILSAREVVVENIQYGNEDALIAVVITNEDGHELARISAKDVMPEALK